MNFDAKQIPIVVTFLLSTCVLLFKLAQLQLIDDTYKKIAERTVLDKKACLVLQNEVEK